MDFRNSEIKVGRRVSLRSADVISGRRFSPSERRERSDDRKYVYASKAIEGSDMLKYVQESLTQVCRATRRRTITGDLRILAY